MDYESFKEKFVGSPYEFDRGGKTKIFPLFSRESRFTDDSVMTVAVAEALMDAKGKSDDEIRKALVASMQKWGRRYPDAGYGGMFRFLRTDGAALDELTENIAAMHITLAIMLWGLQINDLDTNIFNALGCEREEK